MYSTVGPLWCHSIKKNAVGSCDFLMCPFTTSPDPSADDIATKCSKWTQSELWDISSSVWGGSETRNQKMACWHEQGGTFAQNGLFCFLSILRQHEMLTFYSKSHFYYYCCSCLNIKTFVDLKSLVFILGLNYSYYDTPTVPVYWYMCTFCYELFDILHQFAGLEPH